MPGVMPQMPGIMGAPMGPPPGMPGMPPMPGLPPMQQPMPMPMGGPMGAPPPQGGRPASLGTLPAPSTAEQRAGFGAAVGAVASGPVMGAMPADVFAGGIPGGMMDGSIPRPVAMMRGGGAVQYMQEGGPPVDVNQFRPKEGFNLREVLPQLGLDVDDPEDFATGVQLLYGSVGSNVDVRDWNKILSSSDPLRAAQEATRQMYSTGAPIATDPRFYSDGQYTPTSVAGDFDVTDVVGGSGPRLQMYDNQLMVVDAAGLPLTGLTPQNAASFGVTQDQIDAAIAAGAIRGEMVNRFQGVGYQPYDVGNLLVDYSGMTRARPAATSGVSGVSGGGGGGMGGGAQPGYVAEPVPVSQPGGGIMNALPGDVMGTFAGPMMGSVYQPTVSQIPTFVSGASDVFGTRPVTYVTSPQATIRSRLGEIDLPARPESVNVFDWLSTPVAGFGGNR
jgi:hypothetical protein